MYNCPEHGINCPANFSFNNNKKLVLKNNNNKIGKPFGASDVNININKFESFDNIRKMVGFNNKSMQLKGASDNQQNICHKTKSLINLKQQFGLT
jgi:hypothetical protein